MKANKQIVPINTHQSENQHPHLDTYSRILPVTLANIVDIQDGYPLVHWESCSSTKPIQALTQVKIEERHINKSCTLAFINGDTEKPIVMGLLYNPAEDSQEESQKAKQKNTKTEFDKFGADINGNTPVIIQSDDSIILETGKAKIQLYADGRINLQGLQINSQAYGPNKIKGSSVKIN